jgi:pimeloyl-ACP methyl ester carboxylesterase
LERAARLSCIGLPVCSVHCRGLIGHFFQVSAKFSRLEFRIACTKSISVREVGVRIQIRKEKMMRHIGFLLFGLAAFGFLQWSVEAQTKKDDFKGPPPKFLEQPQLPPKLIEVPPPGPSFRHLDGQRILFVANGVNNSTILSDNLIEISSDMNLGLRVQMVAWTRTLSLFGDLTDREAQYRAANGMANMARCVRRDCPHAQIFFLGHSAGAHVVLAAAAMMPEKSVDRIIVLHSAVSATYDLKPALRASRYGIDNFYSSEDSVLDSAVQHATTADGTKIPCAGRIGVRLPCPTPEEVAAYRNVRNYRWYEDLCGNGGHYAWTLQPNLKKCVLPLLYSFPPVHVPVVVMPPPLPALKDAPLKTK